MTDKAVELAAEMRRRVAMRRRYLFDCKVCDTEFIARDPRAKFCSNACRQANKYEKRTGGEYA